MSLPDGWIEQYDRHYKRSFWVDTKSVPPRAIWVHPYEDEQFLAEHPDVRQTSAPSDVDAPPSYDVATEGRASGSGSGEKASSSQYPDPPSAASSQKDRKRGVFGKVKDKAIGTKEEREEQRRIRAEQAARAEEEARQARMRELEAREAYMRAHGGYAPYHPSYAGGPSYGPYSYGPTSQRGGDNTAALLLGGLAGGLLLGDIFGGGGLF